MMLATNKGGTDMKYRLFTYDVWGNSDDGYEVNEVYKTDTYIHLTEDFEDKDIIKTMIRCGIINNNCKGKIEFQGDFEFGLYAVWANTGKPMFELRPCN